jgi:hypothetical protein
MTGVRVDLVAAAVGCIDVENRSLCFLQLLRERLYLDLFEGPAAMSLCNKEYDFRDASIVRGCVTISLLKPIVSSSVLEVHMRYDITEKRRE